MTIKEENKRDDFANNNDEALKKYHSIKIAIGILDDDLSDHYNEWIGTQSLEQLKKIIGENVKNEMP